MDLNIFTIDVHLNLDQTEHFSACYSFLNKSILINLLIDLSTSIFPKLEIRINIREIA